MTKSAESVRAYQRAWKASKSSLWTSEGRCGQCGRKTVDGAKLCPRHQLYHRARKADFALEGRCKQCGRHSVHKARRLSLCEACRVKQNAYSRRRYLLLKSMGLCVMCKAPTNGKVLCERHGTERKGARR